jgi:probable HAF family extracellular repeat protein
MPRFLLLFLLCLALSSPLFAGGYRFVDIDPPGSTESHALGINARGDICGRYVDAQGNSHGFLLRKGQYTNIDVPGANFSAARAVNAEGDIVGRVRFSDGVDHAFLYHAGKYTVIDYPGSTATVGRGINNAGDVMGNFTDASDNEIGFILKDGKFHQLLVPSGQTTDIWSTQDNGQVMIGDAAMQPDSQLYGYIRRGSGVFQLLRVPESRGFNCTAPRWINQRGDIAGLYVVAKNADQCYNEPTNSHGFLLIQGQYTTVDVPNGSFSEIFGMNDDGILVGDYVDNTGMTHGFKASPIAQE